MFVVFFCLAICGIGIIYAYTRVQKEKQAARTTVAVQNKREKNANVQDQFITEIRTYQRQNVQSDESLSPEKALNKRISESYPSKEGLYPHELLMLYSANQYKIGETTFPDFWFYRHDVTNPSKLLNSLVDRGFLIKEDISAILNRTNMSQLKEVAKSFCVKTSGKKIDLIARLQESIPQPTLEELFPSERYMPSIKGKIELEQNLWIEEINRYGWQYELDIWQMCKLVHEPPEYLSWRDKIWRHLNTVSIDHITRHEFGLYRNIRYAMTTFLIREKKFQEALAMLSEVMYYDLSGLQNGSETYYNEFEIDGFFPYKGSCATIAPGIVTEMDNLCEILNLSDDTLQSILQTQFAKYSTLRHLFTKQECVDIALAEHRHDFETLVKIYEVAESRFKTTAKIKRF